ncbi:hypothetical protein, partial [Priestia megaterium]|uniref:hypothetical protein n=1 Tax=Priestia megaterium TaxID=1404 RepID=UPI002FFFC162
VTQDKGVDFVLWLDELDEVNQLFGNILLIEMKIGSLTKEVIDAGERQLQQYLENTNNKVGLLLYFDREGKRFKLGGSLNPLIIRMDIEDFIFEVNKKKNLVNVILDCRNKIAHGMEG